MQYKHRGNRHQITLAGKTFWVDSNQEEYLLRLLEESGFTDRWRRLEHGINVTRNNYTPDLELSIEFEGMTHRALVESKPTLSAFTPYISRRMRGIAKHYFTDILLLYVHDKQAWYRVDKKTGDLSLFSPVPGKIPIRKLYKPFTKRAPNIRYHRYRKRLELGKMAAGKIADVLELGVKALFTPRKTRRRRRR